MVPGVCGKTHLRVNSLHHQAIKNPGAGLQVVGRDLDDITQAVECASVQHLIASTKRHNHALHLRTASLIVGIESGETLRDLMPH